MRKALGVLVVAVSCTLVFSGCGKGDGSSGSKPSAGMEDGMSTEAKPVTEASEDKEDEAGVKETVIEEEPEDVELRQVDISALPAFEEFLSNRKNDLKESDYNMLIERANDDLSNNVHLLDRAGLKLDINADIGLEDSYNGSTYIVFKNMKQYNSNLNDKYYMMLWADNDPAYKHRKNWFINSNAAALLADKLNVWNNKKRDITNEELQDSENYLTSVSGDDIGIFWEYMGSDFQVDPELNDKLKDILGDKYDDVTKEVNDALTRVSKDMNVLNMLDVGDEKIGLVATQKDDTVYYLIGVMDDSGKIKGDEYLLYYAMAKFSFYDWSNQIIWLAEIKAGPNGGGPIDETVYGKPKDPSYNHGFN